MSYCRFYSTNQLVVAFECIESTIHCTIYRKATSRSDNFKVLQSFHMKRKGFNQLFDKNKLSVLRTVIKTMRNRQSKALESILIKR